MAVTVTALITGQEITPATTYCYLYEPLQVSILEDDLDATKIFVDLLVYDTVNNDLIKTKLQYAEFDLNPGLPITFDLMNLAKQYHNAGVYSFGDINDIVTTGFESIVSRYKYTFRIYSELSATSLISKLPIIGGRELGQFVATVDENQPLDEFDYYGVDKSDLIDRWGGSFSIASQLVDPTLANAKPIQSVVPGTGKTPCGGYLFWKSRFGGWMFWGFEIKKRVRSGSYTGKKLDVGLFEAKGGIPYIPVDYTGIETKYRTTLKSLSLSSNELEAVSGIYGSTAGYFMEAGSTKMELMRINSATVPLSSLSNGGDFSVVLESISTSNQKTI